MGDLFSKFLSISILCSVLVILVCISTDSGLWNSPPISGHNLLFLIFLDDSHSDWGEVKPHCGFYFLFPCLQVILNIFSCILTNWFSSLDKYLFFAHFLSDIHTNFCCCQILQNQYFLAIDSLSIAWFLTLCHLSFYLVVDLFLQCRWFSAWCSRVYLSLLLLLMPLRSHTRSLCLSQCLSNFINVVF